ncbi:MAG: alkaline phosphatase, partial [Verrucomicrobiota bacterium]
TYSKKAPSVADMTEAALKWLSTGTRPYFLVVEEEGTDNFANAMNAPGTMEAFRRADAAIGVARKHVAADPDLTLLVAADSEAGIPTLVPAGRASDGKKGEKVSRLPGTTPAGAPLDGAEGTGTRPFLSATDRFGERHYFGIAWISGGDHYGSVVARAEGSRADQLPLNLDNTGVHHFIRGVLLE